MIRTIVAATAAALLAFSPQDPASADGPTEVPEAIEWEIASNRSEGDERVQLTLSYRSRGGHSQWSNSINTDELQGFDPAQLAARADGPVRFRIVRDAGRFDCEGIARRQGGRGECRFESDPAFAAELERRGIGRPTRAESFGLALARVGIELLDSLDRHHYSRPAVGDLMRSGIHGVTATYVDEMTRAGWPAGALGGLVEMRIHGVSAPYVRALAEAGYRPDAAMVRQLAIHGVTIDFIREMGDLGYSRLTAEELVTLRIHGVSAQFVRALAELGYEGLSADQLRSMRIHGVTADYVRAKLRPDFRPTPEELVSLRIRGA